MSKLCSNKSLRVNFWEISQVTSTCQIDFFDKTSKKIPKTEKGKHHHRLLHIR